MMKKIFAFLICLVAFTSPAWASITFTAAGTQSSTSSNTLTLNSSSTSPASIPAGSVIILSVTDLSGSGTLSSVADNAGNVYSLATSKALNGSSATGTGFVYISYTGNALNLTASGTITYTLNFSSGPRSAVASVSYASGTLLSSSVLDATVTATASGNSGTITVGSGIPAVANELLICVFSNNNASTFTQDSGNGWAAPPTRAIQGSSSQIAGGSQVASAAKTCVPTLGTKGSWAIQTIGLKPAVTIATPFIFLPAIVP